MSTNLWCTESLTDSPSTSRFSAQPSGWMSAERRRFNGISLDASAPRQMANSAQRHHFCHQHQPQQSRRSLGFAPSHNENLPQPSSNRLGFHHQQHQQASTQNNRKSQLRVLSQIDTNSGNCQLRRHHSLNVPQNQQFRHQQQQQQLQQQYQPSIVAVPAVPSATLVSSPVHSAQRSAARKRRMAVDQQLNVPQRLWVSADVDKAVHLDGRALAALLNAERYVLPNGEHFRALQTEINENVRRSAIVCISDICTRENCDLVVFPLAVSYIDRVLSVQFVPRHNLLALANACLLLASKMKAPRPLTALQVVEHTDKWVTLDELLDWELFIVNKLGWQLSTATAFEFFDQLMVRAPILETLREQFAQTLQVMLKGREFFQPLLAHSPPPPSSQSFLRHSPSPP